MTKDEFIKLYEHEFEGWIFDAMSERREGGLASLFMKSYRERVRVVLARIFEEKLKGSK